MKTFSMGQDVEIQRDPSAKWEPATYLAPTSMKGWHCVQLPKDAPGVVVQIDAYHSIGSHRTHVPARRIRARKS